MLTDSTAASPWWFPTSAIGCVLTDIFRQRKGIIYLAWLHTPWTRNPIVECSSFKKWLVYLAIEMRTNRFFSHHPPTIYSFTRCRVPPFYLFRKSYPAVLFQLTGTGVHGGHLENEKLCPADCNVFPRLFHYPSCIVLSINFLWLSLLDWRAQNTAVLGTQMAGKYVENTDGIW